VRHEPESCIHADAPLVSRGRIQSTTTASYTCDFVVTSKNGLFRLYVESKSTLGDVDEVTVGKCLRLRDTLFCRTIVMYGNGTRESIRYKDFGNVLSGEEVDMDEAGMILRLKTEINETLIR